MQSTHTRSKLPATEDAELLAAATELKCEVLSSGKPAYYSTDPQKIPDLICNHEYLIQSYPCSWSMR